MRRITAPKLTYRDTDVPKKITPTLAEACFAWSQLWTKTFVFSDLLSKLQEAVKIDW